MGGLTLIHEGITYRTSRVYDMNSAIITEVGRGPAVTLVVDPGIAPDELADLADAAATTPAGRAMHVLFTHGDYDHVLGWAEFPGATLVGQRSLAANLSARGDDLRAATDKMDRRYGVVRPRPFTPPPAELITTPATLALGAETALLFPAPGHTDDGLFTVLPLRRTLIAGDYLSDMEFPFIYFSLSRYRKTLELARNLCDRWGIERLIPGHGKVALQRSEIDFRITTDVDYLDGLKEAVAALHRAGVPLDEAQVRLEPFTFRGQPLHAGLAGAHGENVKFLYEHPEELA